VDSGGRRRDGDTAGTSTAIERMLPLKPRWFHVLLAVAGGQHHGYAIRQEVETRTAGRVRLWPATLYGTLAELTSAGLLEEVAEGTASSETQDARRRNYRVTRVGKRVLEAETRRLEELVRYARSGGVLREAGRSGR
jgi:DNA-binding PadR family transcriptional regulator